MFPSVTPMTEKRPFLCQSGRRSSLRSTRASLVAAGLLVFNPAAAMADAVYWGTQGFHRLEDSRGRQWDPGFRMKLGVFPTGFTPRPENVDQWASHWIELDAAVFDPDERRFAGLVDDAQPLPAGADRQVFIWAMNGTDLTQGPEWLLLTRQDWVWNGRISNNAAPAKTWIADDASIAILGTVSEQQVHLASAAVRPPPVTMGGWLADWFAGTTADASPSADPDGDGLVNRLEYFLGTDPTKPSSLAGPEIAMVPGGVRLALGRNPYAVSTFVLETSTDLKSWQPGAATTVEERPDRIELLAPKGTGGHPVFYRFQLQSPDAE